MDSENIININQANEETLTQLKGVGSRLAKRIIAARPFESIEDLRRVRGISEKDVERLRPFLSISQATAELEEAEVETPAEVFAEVSAEPEVAETEVEDVLEIADEADEIPFEEIADESALAVPEPKLDSEPESEEIAFEPISESESEPVAEELEPVAEVQASQTAAQPSYNITRGRAFGLIFFSCLFTLILAIAITLGILSSINRGHLTYATPAQVSTLQSQLNGLAIQAETLTSDMDGLRTRLDNLEALSGRVNDIESEITAIYGDIGTLQGSIDTVQAQYEELESQLETINAEIETLQTQGSRFEGFLAGLRDLMTGLFPDVQE